MAMTSPWTVVLVILMATCLRATCPFGQQLGLLEVKEEEKEWTSATEHVDPCEEMCSHAQELGCDCGDNCLVYHRCCDGLSQVCPGRMNRALSRYDHRLLDAGVRCGPRTGRLEVDRCVKDNRRVATGRNAQPGANDDARSLPWTHGNNFKGPFDQFPIYDTELDLLFSNISVYSCYRNNFSSAQLWQMVAKVSFEDEFDTTDDIKRLLNTTDFFFRSVNESQDGVACTDYDLSRDFIFSVTVDVQERFLQVDFFPRSTGYQFETMLCENKDGGFCLHTGCGPMATLSSGKCVQHANIAVRFSHPPVPFELAQVMEVGRYLRCVGLIQSRALSWQVAAVTRRATFPLMDVTVVPKHLQHLVEYFEIVFQIDDHNFDWTLKTSLLQAVAALYQRLGLVEVEGFPYLKFVRGSDLAENGNSLRQTTNDSLNISSNDLLASPEAAAGRSEASSSSRPAVSQDGGVGRNSSDRFDLAVGCVNVYVVQPMESSPALCQDGLFLLERSSTDYGQCMQVVDGLLTNGVIGFTPPPCPPLLSCLVILAVLYCCPRHQ